MNMKSKLSFLQNKYYKNLIYIKYVKLQFLPFR